VGGTIKNQEWVSPSLNTTADGALYFSLRDLARWGVALNHGKIPSRRVVAAAWTPVTLKDGGTFPYGMGWDLGDQRGRRRIGHTGSWQGFKTAMFRYPDYDLTVAMLANLAEAQPGALVQAIAGILEPSLTPAHTDAATAEKPPFPVADLIREIATGVDADHLTPALRRFLSPLSRKEWADVLESATGWTSMGCDPVAKQSILRLGAAVERICYARTSGTSGSSLVSAYYGADGRAAYVNAYSF
jgi:hypothetical protein